LICSYSSRRRTSSARGSPASSISSSCLLGQQHARLDLDQHRRHQQVFGSQFQVALADLLDIFQVLQGDLGHRDVEDVEVLLADQVEQQVERPFEGVEEDLERIGRDVQVVRHAQQRLAVQARDGACGCIGSAAGSPAGPASSARPSGVGLFGHHRPASGSMPGL
jgi:hypothetical protein